MRLDQIFRVEYGNKFDMNKMTDANVNTGVAFVGRKGSDQGVSGYVDRVDGVAPYPAGLLTVALGGSRLLATFVQQRAFYTAQNVAVLQPRKAMTLPQKLFFAKCIEINRFRYSAFGREANRTLSSIELPPEAPEWANDLRNDTEVPRNLFGQRIDDSRLIDYDNTPVPLSNIFDIKYGHSLELNRLTQVQPPQGVNFVSRTTQGNGISARVQLPPNVSPAPGQTLSCALGGTPLTTFYQPEEYVCGRDVSVLTPLNPMTKAEMLWWKTAIEANRYRYSYGRQANRTLSSLLVPAAPPKYLNTVVEDAQADRLFHN